MNDKMIFFGAGKHLDYILSEIKATEYLDLKDVVCIVDNDSLKWGGNREGITICSPEQIKVICPDIVIVSCINGNDEVRRQAARLTDSSDTILMTWDEYKRQRFCKVQYKKRYNGHIGEYKELYGGERIVVYTAITGGYDDLKPPLFRDDQIEYVCFSDTKDILSNGWNIEYIHKNNDSIMQSKQFKVLPHKFFREYSLSVWVDGKFEIRSDIREYIKKYWRGNKMLCFPHYERKCIYEEASVCIERGLGNKADIIRQFCQYYSEGYPIDNGLYEMGCIVREHNDEKIISLMDRWWMEIVRCSKRDQISFPYVCWKENYIPDISDVYIYMNKWLKLYSHNEWRR